MPSCYICGAPDAHNRRDVYTGSSSGWWLSSRRTIGVSGRSYSGVRTVCDECVRQMDRQRIFKSVFKYGIGAIIIYYFFFNKSSNVDPFTRNKIEQEVATSFDKPHYMGIVIPKKGLSLRQLPTINALKLYTIPYNQDIEIIRDTILNNQKWMQVKYQEMDGWVFGKYVLIK